MIDKPSIKGAINIYLANCDHPQHEAQAEDALRRLYKLLKDHFEPPPLGINVNDGLNTKDKFGA